MKRRPFLLALAAGSGCWPWPLTHAQASADVAALLRAGGCVVMLRHAQTEAGIGDPPGFRVDQCSTQRNLSPEGRAQARRIGEWFKARDLQARAVQSSAWCRCRDTADLAFGRHTVLPALASTFNRGADEAAQTRVLRGLLDAVPPGQFDVWVTHQVNISSLTGEGPAMGEAFILGAGGKILAQTRFG
ncbi:histidine phosphatase family protein [Polaromonas sp. JS666]|uniref:histidine phosphatase family protein n=1 Tax=Polaromonas sp. (strain JS666 / ATCC BAA-500) TaxID=296591 RepID=UPI000053676C|nr:histidine phosphatase family protein [Polaromonas sp. JS666]ABE46777.1 Phosphoglycerate mutase [Polaromonas sp. JS666]